MTRHGLPRASCVRATRFSSNVVSHRSTAGSISDFARCEEAMEPSLSCVKAGANPGRALLGSIASPLSSC